MARSKFQHLDTYPLSPKTLEQLWFDPGCKSTATERVKISDRVERMGAIPQSGGFANENTPNISAPKVVRSVHIIQR